MWLNMSKVVLITGGAKRLGAAFCNAFSDAGWQIACHYSHSVFEAKLLQSQLQSNGKVCELFQSDLSDQEQTKQLFAQVIDRFERLDCIINNASVFSPDEGFNFTQQTYSYHHDVNVLAPLLLTQLLAKHCKESACISTMIHILDQKVDNLNPDYFSYTLSKLTLRDAVKLQAQAFAPFVRVIGISPGLIYVSGPQTLDNFKKAASINLLKTPTNPAMVAKSAVDLAENEAVNGAILNVDSGQHLVPLGRDVMFIVDQL